MRCNHNKCSKKARTRVLLCVFDENEKMLKGIKKRLCDKHSNRLLRIIAKKEGREE